MNFLGYRNLTTYTKAQEIVLKVYEMLSLFPKEEQFALCSQLRRSAVSVTSNLAEGVSRYSYKEKIHFLELSFGSLMEVMSQLEIAQMLGYISKEDLHNMELLVAAEAQLITNLQYSYIPKGENGETLKPYKRPNS